MSLFRYFTDQKKGEVNELRMVRRNSVVKGYFGGSGFWSVCRRHPANLFRAHARSPLCCGLCAPSVPPPSQLLKQVNVDRDPKRKRDVIKKVIAYMTLGIDVSRLFNEMVLCVESRDLVVKKMVYLYLATYAQEHPEMALMCINTLHRDCNDQDPMVRGLALRSLCSLRLPSIVEYIADPLRKSLTDGNAYVRKTGVMGILKLFNLKPEMVKDSNLIDLLYNMIQDPDGGVVANCIMVLNEVMLNDRDEGCGGMAINQPLIHHLLGRLNDFNEWGLHSVLELVARYEPVDDAEVFAIMNLLDPVLRTSNSAVVLVTIKAFIHLTRRMAAVHRQLFERIKPPVLTLLAQGSSPEVVFCMLKHTELLVHRCPGIFDDDFKAFYTKYDEPLHVKYLKVGLLAQLSNGANGGAILEELAEYVAEVDVELARRALRAIGVVACRAPADPSPADTSGGALEKLVEFLELGVDYVVAEALLVLKDVLRVHPHRRAALLPHLPRCLRAVDEPPARAALLFFLGEYGAEVAEAPYLVEPLADGYAEESSGEVKLALLACAMKLFFARPPECHAMLGRLLLAATNDGAHPDVHDRALLYYRLLRADPAAAQRVVMAGNTLFAASGGRRFAGGFSEDKEGTVKDRLFDEFDSLAVVYDKESKHFIAPDKRPRDVAVATGGSGGAAEPEAAAAAAATATAVPAVAAGSDSGGFDLLGSGDLLGETSAPVAGGGASGGAQPPAAQPPAAMTLSESPGLDGDSFQASWGAWAEGLTETCSVPAAAARAATAEAVDAHLALHKVMTMASGDLADSIKLFLYAQEAGGSAVFLAECTVTPSTGAVQAVLKTAPGDVAKLRPFWALLKAGFAALPPPSAAPSPLL